MVAGDDHDGDAGGGDGEEGRGGGGECGLGWFGAVEEVAGVDDEVDGQLEGGCEGGVVAGDDIVAAVGGACAWSGWECGADVCVGDVEDAQRSGHAASVANLVRGAQ